MSAKKRRRKNAGTVSITIIVLAFLAVMAVQICKLKQKDSDYQAKEAELQQEKQDETQRSSELDDLEEYMKSSQYIEDVAKSLGLLTRTKLFSRKKRSRERIWADQILSFFMFFILRKLPRIGRGERF